MRMATSPFASEVLPRTAPQSGISTNLVGRTGPHSSVSSGWGRGEKLACIQSPVDARLSAGCLPPITNTQGTT